MLINFPLYVVKTIDVLFLTYASDCNIHMNPIYSQFADETRWSIRKKQRLLQDLSCSIPIPDRINFQDWVWYLISLKSWYACSIGIWPKRTTNSCKMEAARGVGRRFGTFFHCMCVCVLAFGLIIGKRDATNSSLRRVAAYMLQIPQNK